MRQLMRGISMNDKTYELVGIFNYFEVLPVGVYPVFKGDDGELYWAFTDNKNNENWDETKYSQFLKFPERYKEKVRFLSDCDTTLEIDQNFYGIGDEAVCGYEITEGKIYLGPFSKYYDFLIGFKEYTQKNYNEDDKIMLLEELQEEIDDLSEILSPEQKKKKSLYDSSLEIEKLIEEHKKIKKRNLRKNGLKDW